MAECSDQANLEQLIASTVTMLCKNTIPYSSELRIQGTVGITVDATKVILVHLNQRIECGVEDSHGTASACITRGAGDSVKANTYLLADARQPRMSSAITPCSRRPVGRGHVSVRGRIRSGQAVIGVQRSRQLLPRPAPSKATLMKPRGRPPHTPVRHVTPSLSTSRQFSAKHVASCSETLQPLPAKLEVEAVGQSAGETTRCLPMSSDIICVESDDETEGAAAAVKPVAITSRLNATPSVKSEGQSMDALQMIVDRAIVAARASHPDTVRTFHRLFCRCQISNKICVSFMPSFSDAVSVVQWLGQCYISTGSVPVNTYVSHCLRNGV